MKLSELLEILNNIKATSPNKTIVLGFRGKFKDSDIERCSTHSIRTILYDSDEDEAQPVLVIRVDCEFESNSVNPISVSQFVNQINDELRAPYGLVNNANVLFNWVEANQNRIPELGYRCGITSTKYRVVELDHSVAIKCDIEEIWVQGDDRVCDTDTDTVHYKL